MNSKWDFSSEAEDLLLDSTRKAISYHSSYIIIEHIFLCILEHKNEIIDDIFAHFKISPSDICPIIDSFILKHRNEDHSPTPNNPPFIRQATSMFDLAALLAKKDNNSEIMVYHLFLAILKQEDTFSSWLMNRKGITFEMVYSYLKELINKVNIKKRY